MGDLPLVYKMTDSPFIIEDGYVKHNLIKDNVIGYREYQKQIAEVVSEESSLVALPTAAGKTIIAAMAAAERLNSMGGRILFLAPNKPLVRQQADEFKRVLDIFDTDVIEMTGEVGTDKREKIWNNKEGRIFFATPQVIENDILSSRIDLTDFTQIIFDECHKATGDYAYTFIAEEYYNQQSSEKHLVLGLSASPGSDEQSILQICENLKVTNVEIFSSDHELLKEHITTPDVTARKVDIDDEIHEMRDLLQEASQQCYKKLKKNGYLDSARKNLSFGELQGALGDIKKGMDNGESEAYEAMSIHAEAMKLYQAGKIIDTQGVSALVRYLDRQFEEAKDSDASKAVKRMCRRDKVQEAYEKAKSYDKLHPKKTVLRTYLVETVASGGQMILFTEYTDTAEELAEFINNEHEGMSAKKFVGQQEMSQKEQQQILDEFREGGFDVLVSTSVGEEGLDIPAASMVVFYEPIGSSLRTIQRRGRTARKGQGDVIILIGKGTRDEGLYYAAKNNEDTMKEELSALSQSNEDLQSLIDERLETGNEESMDDKEDIEDGQLDITQFENTSDNSDTSDETGSKDVGEREEETTTPEPEITEDDMTHIIADSREMKSTVVRELYQMDDVTVEPEQIEVGDFIAGPETAIERKEVSDLVSTLTGDRDIFEQVQNMVDSYDRAVIIIEGGKDSNQSITSEMYSKGVHPNAIRGLLDSVTSSFNVDLFYSTGEEDTARWIKTIAERAQKDSTSEVSAHGKKKTQTMEDQQEYVVSSIADVGPVTARKLLSQLGSVENVFTADVDELQTVDGVGQKTAEKIREVITENYPEE